MHALVLLWFLLLSIMVASCQDTRPAGVLEPSEPNNGCSTDLEIEEGMKVLRKEMVRLQILSKLNLEEAHPSAQPATEASREIIQLLLKEEEDQTRDESGEKLVIHAKGGQDIEDTGDRRPFLMEPSLVPVRQRRDVDCNPNKSCCLKPLKIFFDKIGFSRVLYPSELDVNMCIGKCTMDYSAMRTHYERVLALILESDSSLHASLGECWTLCCKPKELEQVSVIYNDTDGIIKVAEFQEMRVKSCGCS